MVKKIFTPEQKKKQKLILQTLLDDGVFPETVIDVGERLILETRKIMERDPSVSKAVMEEYIENIQEFLTDLRAKLKIPKSIVKH